MALFELVPDAPLLLILRFIGRPIDFLPILSVSKQWRCRLDPKDPQLWLALSIEYGLTMRSLGVKRSLRCTEDHRKMFFKAYFEKVRAMEEAHELAVVQSRHLLQLKKDQPKKLDKIIRSLIPDVRYFNPNYRCKMIEDNTLLTLAARNCQNKCMKLLVESFGADVNIPDVGGFTPLILCAYQGNFAGVLYLLSKGANIRLSGRLRSGPCLIAEHWAAVMGNMEIFRYLHAMRRRNVVVKKDKSVAAPEMAAEPQPCPNSPSIQFPTSSSSALHTSISHLTVLAHSMSSYSPLTELSMEDASTILAPTTIASHSDSGDGAITTAPLHIVSQPPNLPRSSNDGTATTADTNTVSAISGSAAGVSGTGTGVGPIPAGAIQSTESADQDAPQCFCYCHRGFLGQMIACDEPGCAVEWFHYECVGLRGRPTGRWYCPACTSARRACSAASDALPPEQCPESEEYCICGRPYVGAMVGCDNPTCFVEWYHFECVQLTTEPARHWECPACSGGRFQQPLPTPSVALPAHSAKRRRRKAAMPLESYDTPLKSQKSASQSSRAPGSGGALRRSAAAV